MALFPHGWLRGDIFFQVGEFSEVQQVTNEIEALGLKVDAVNMGESLPEDPSTGESLAANRWAIHVAIDASMLQATVQLNQLMRVGRDFPPA